MSPGFEQLRPSIEGADRRIDAGKTNVNLSKVEAEFKKVEGHAKMQTDPALREKYEAILREQRARFEALQDGNDQKHLDALRAAVRGTLVALDDFVYENGDFLQMNYSRQYAETTGVASVYAAWRKESNVAFSTLAHIIKAYLPGVGSYGSEKYRQAVFLFLNQRQGGAQGHGAPYDISRIHDAAEWTRAEAELRKIKVGEEFDFWKVRVALNQPISRPPTLPQAAADGGPIPDLVPLVPPVRRRERSAGAPAAVPTARPAPAPASAPAAGPTEEVALTSHEQVALNSFSQGIEKAFRALQSAGENGEAIQRALRNIKAQADDIALYGKQNPTSNALPKLRIMRMQCEAFLTQAGLALRAGQADQIAKGAREDTHGFWSNLRVLNAIPKMYRATTGDQDTLTYSEARSRVMDMRTREVSRAAKGAEVVFTALSKEPPITMQQIRGMGPKRLVDAGLATAEKANEIHSAIQNFFTSPEGRRLAAIDENRLTAELDQRLAREALRVEEGTVLGVSQAKWERMGDVSSSLASLDLFLLPGGGMLLGKLAARSALAVRAAAAAAKGFEAAKAVRGAGLLIRAGEKFVTWSPQEFKALQAAEKAGRAVNVAKALARGTLTVGTSLVKFTAATAAAEALVPGSGHLVLASCFLVPGAVKGFSEAVGKNVSEAFALAGGNMTVGQMPEMTRAYLLYLRNTQTQAALARNLQGSLQKGGMAAAEAEKAASAFSKDLFEGQTGRELEGLASRKIGLAGRVKEYVKARREMVRPTLERGIPVKSEALRNSDLQDAAVKLREALGPIGKIDKLPAAIWNRLSADARQTVTDFTSACQNISGAVRKGMNISGEWIAARRQELTALRAKINSLPREAQQWAIAQWERFSAGFENVLAARRRYNTVRRAAQQQEGGLAGKVGGIPERYRPRLAEARTTLSKDLGVDKLLSGVGVARKVLAPKIQAAIDGFVAARRGVVLVLQSGKKITGDALRTVLSGIKTMVEHLNGLTNGPRQLWKNAFQELKNVWQAAKGYHEARGILQEEAAKLRLNTPTGSTVLSALLHNEEGRVAKAAAELRRALGPIGQIDKIPAKIRAMLSEDLRKTVADFAGAYNRAVELVRGGVKISREQVGGFVTMRRGELTQLWKRISGLPTAAQAWAKTQWAKLSNPLERFADSWKAKGVQVADATEEYLAARRLLRGAKEGGGTVGIARQAPGVEAAGRELQEALGVHRIVALPGRLRTALSADIRKTVEDFAGAYNRVAEAMRGGLNISREKVGEFITARRGELMQLWKSISGLPAVARGWAQAQWLKLSNVVEGFVRTARGRGERIARAPREYLEARKALRAAEEFERPIREMNLEDRLGIPGLESGAQRRLAAARVKFEVAQFRLWRASGIDAIITLPEKLRTNVGEAGAAILQRLNAVRESVGKGLSVPLKEASTWISARRGELSSLWGTIQSLPGGLQKWAASQWMRLSNVVEGFATMVKGKGERVANATGEYMLARKAVRAAGKVEGGVLSGGTVRLAAEKRALERARVAFADAIGLTQLKSLANTAILGLKEGTQKAVRALVTDTNAFVEKYAGVKQAIGIKSAAFIAEVRKLQAHIGELMGELPDDSPLRPLLAATGERLGNMLK
ncbi:hypothetical protein HYW83_05550 [Candidatus Peregrinibacteria bacterium]|nr:hypothetical protein [Candidatus Peregrinibacteria bacterium]